MYSKKVNTPINSVPSDAQAKEKLALYVYEYLQYVGATGAAQTFLNEIQWNKQITLGEKPGFLQSWWCVFWDLYCAAPERRDSCEHSSEAKAFHDYNYMNPGFTANGMHGPNPAPSPLGIAPQGPDGMPPPGPAGMGHPQGPGFFPHGVPGPHNMRPSPPQQAVSQPSPHAMIGQPAFMPGGRYPAGPRGSLRLAPQDQPPYGGSPVPGGPPMFADQLRPGVAPQLMPPQRIGPGGGHPRMSPMSQNNFPGMRPLINSPMGPGMGPAHLGGRWPASMQYSEPGPGQFPGPSAMSVSNGPPPGPGTPINMRSPQMPDGPSDRYNLMQPGGPPMVGFPMSSEQSGGVVNISDIMMNGDGLDIKSSPASTHGLNGTPGPGGPNSVPPPTSAGDSCSLDYGQGINPFQSSSDQEAEIQKIKDSICEESKRFESKEGEGGEFYNLR